MIIFPCVKSRKNMQPDMWLRLVNVPLDNVHLFSVFFMFLRRKHARNQDGTT